MFIFWLDKTKFMSSSNVWYMNIWNDMLDFILVITNVKFIFVICRLSFFLDIKLLILKKLLDKGFLNLSSLFMSKFWKIETHVVVFTTLKSMNYAWHWINCKHTVMVFMGTWKCVTMLMVFFVVLMANRVKPQAKSIRA